mgnify:FL=1
MLRSRHFSKQAELTLKQAVKQVNLGNEVEAKLTLALLEVGKQNLIELRQEQEEEEARSLVTERLINSLRKLVGYSTEEKIYVLKNLSEKQIDLLREILNAHNIKLRAFIMS